MHHSVTLLSHLSGKKKTSIQIILYMYLFIFLPEMRLDLHLSPQLVLHTCFLQLLFEEHLQGQDEFGLALSG